MVIVSKTKLPNGAVGAEVLAPKVTLPVGIHPLWKKQCAAHSAVLGPIMVAVHPCDRCANALPEELRAADPAPVVCADDEAGGRAGAQAAEVLGPA